MPEVIRQLVRDYVYQIKFVIDSPRNCEEVEAWLAGFPEINIHACSSCRKGSMWKP